MSYKKYVGNAFGIPAQGDTVSVDTPLIKSQRLLNETKVNDYINISKGLNWSIFQRVMVARFPDGTLHLIDGQHRIDIVRKILPDLKQVPAYIVDCTAYQAAEWFELINGRSSSHLKAEDRFWSQLQINDQLAVMMSDTLKKTNFYVGQVNYAQGKRPLAFAGFKKSLKAGEAEFIRACEIIDECFPGDNDYGLLLEGITQIFAVPEYSDMMDGTKGIGKQFVEWFKTLRTNLGVKPYRFKFPNYHNAGPISLAVAYGVCRNFFASQRAQDRRALHLKIIEDKWLSYAKQKEADSLIFMA